MGSEAKVKGLAKVLKRQHYSQLKSPLYGDFTWSIQ